MLWLWLIYPVGFGSRCELIDFGAIVGVKGIFMFPIIDFCIGFYSIGLFDNDDWFC